MTDELNWRTISFTNDDSRTYRATVVSGLSERETVSYGNEDRVIYCESQLLRRERWQSSEDSGESIGVEIMSPAPWVYLTLLTNILKFYR